MTVVDVPADRSELLAGTPIEDRESRLAGGADSLAGRRSLVGGSNVLLVAAATLFTTGLTAIVLGWVGASHSTIVAEQVPYLISGGLLGLALAVAGAITYFAHWQTQLVRDARAQHAEVLEALRQLQGSQPATAPAPSPSPRPAREKPLRP